jgi:hypothetical protein
MVLAMLLGSGGIADAQQPGPRRPSQPLVLQEQGSFYVGGERTEIQFSAFGGARPGHILANAMYVEYLIPPGAKKKLPVVMWSGGCHTGKSFETTPDGREGWQTIFLRRGYPVYVVDATWRGRSAISQNDFQGVRLGALAPSTLPVMLTCDEELAAPAVGGFRLRNSNFPIEALDQYLAQLVPDFFFSAQNGPPPNVAALTALLEEIGPAVVLAHSQGGLTAYPTVIQHPELVEGYVAVEALGSCGAVTDDYPDDVPTLVMSGDPIDPSVPPPFGILGCKTVAESHPNMTVLYLPEEGIFGNSHMMMMDENNVQIADLIIDWIEEHAGRKAR